MSSRFSTWLVGWLLAGTIASMSGCGGGNSGAQVASNAPATPTPSAAPEANQPSEPAEEVEKTPAKPQVSYGGETSSQNAGSGGGARGSSGGNMNSGGEMNSGGGDGYESEEMGSGGAPGMGSSTPGISGRGKLGMAEGMGGPSMGSSSGMMGSSAGMMGSSAGMNSGSEFGGEGDGMGMSGGFPGGPGGMQGDSGFGLVSNFMRQSCLNCHGGNNAKGGVRLDRISQDIASAPSEWEGVVEALESGSMPPRNSQQVNPQTKAKVIAFIRDALSNAPESTFMERAELAYRKGDIEKAKQLFYAQLVTAEDSEISELANHFKLYRPTVSNQEHLTPSNETGVAVKPKLTTNLQLGVGIILKLSGQVTDVKPIGVSQAGGVGGGSGEMTGDGGGSMRGGPGGGRAGANANSKLETFEDLTGDVGQTLVAAFQSRQGAGNYGTLFSSVLDESTEASPVAQPGMGFGNDGSGSSGFGGESEEGIMAGPGMGGMSGGMGGMSGRPGMGGGMAGGPVKTKAGKKLANGLVYIGKAENLNNLLKKSAEAGVDGVIVIEIEASKNLRNIVTNETRLKFMLPSGKIAAAASKTLNNVEVERALAMGKEADDVQKQVDLLFNHLDRILKMSDIPEISAAAALKQLHSRIHSDADRLQVLAEARMFHAKGILSAEQLEMVYQVVFEGNEGTTLASGSTDDRKLVLTSFTEKL